MNSHFIFPFYSLHYHTVTFSSFLNFPFFTSVCSFFHFTLQSLLFFHSIIRTTISLPSSNSVFSFSHPAIKCSCLLFFLFLLAAIRHEKLQTNFLNAKTFPAELLKALRAHAYLLRVFLLRTLRMSSLMSSSASPAEAGAGAEGLTSPLNYLTATAERGRARNTGNVE